MKLLAITQKVDQDDDILGFFHGWIEHISKHTDSLKVLALGKGKYNFDRDVEVASLGKILRKKVEGASTGYFKNKIHI